MTLPSTNWLVATDVRAIRSRLTVVFKLRDGVAVNAALSPSSRALLDRLTTRPSNGLATTSEVKLPADAADQPEDTDDNEGSCTELIEVPLVFDGQFFGMLQRDVVSLQTLQIEERTAMAAEITSLGREIARLSRPSKFAKSGMNRWRAIFELYLDAGIFFSTNEQDGGTHSSKQALKQLHWFQSEVQKRGLGNNFKISESQRALTRFAQLNATILRNLQFQEINQLAVAKILKSEQHWSTPIFLFWRPPFQPAKCCTR